MSEKKKFLIVDDQKSFEEDISSAMAGVNKFDYALKRNFIDAVAYIQDQENDIEIAILDLSFAFDHDIGHESFYGWILIPLIRMHHPSAHIAIHSNTAMHVENMYRALYVYNVENVCHSNFNPVTAPVSDFKKKQGVAIPKTNLRNLNTFLENQKSKSLKDKQEGLDPEQSMILEFARQRRYMPSSAESGWFLKRKDGTEISKKFISATLRKIKSIMKDRGLLVDGMPDDPEILFKILERSNELIQTNNFQLDEIKEPLILLAQGEKISKLPAATLTMTRQGLRKKMLAIYNQIANPTKGEKSTQTQDIAIILCNKFNIPY